MEVLPDAIAKALLISRLANICNVGTTAPPRLGFTQEDDINGVSGKPERTFFLEAQVNISQVVNPSFVNVVESISEALVSSFALNVSNVSSMLLGA
jgi:hypothetical protein